MKTTLVAAIFLLTEIIWTTTSTIILHGKEELSPKVVCQTSYYDPYCDCSDSILGRYLSCTVSTPKDFDGLRDLLIADSLNDYERVQLLMKAALDIPANVLGGKRVQYLALYYPDSSTAAGKIDVDAFRSTSDYTTNVDLNSCNLTNYRFDFLAPFTALKQLGIYSSPLKTITDMPYLPTLTQINMYATTGIEFWYSPSQTPNLETIFINYNPDLDDQKMDSILSSMNNFYTFQKLQNLYLYGNALTRVPPLALAFPALTELSLLNNPIVTLKTGSVNNTYDNLQYLDLSSSQLTTVEPAAFVGNFSSTHIDLKDNPTMTSFPSSSFRNLLKSMVGHSGFVDILNNPIVNDCGLAWLLVDNRELLPYVEGAIANGTAFENLNPDEYSNCF